MASIETIDGQVEEITERMELVVGMSQEADRALNPEELATLEGYQAKLSDLKVQRGALQGVDKAILERKAERDMQTQFRLTGSSAEQAEMRAAFISDVRENVDHVSKNGGQAAMRLKSLMLQTAPQNFRMAWAGLGANNIGGTTVHDDFASQVEIARKRYAVMEGAGATVRFTNGKTFSMPTIDDTDETGETTAENAATSTDNATPWGELAITLYNRGSEAIPMSLDMVRQSEYDIESIGAARAVERVLRATNIWFTNGTGTNQPQGYTRGAEQHKVVKLVKNNGTGNAFVYSELVDIYVALESEYEMGASWMMAKSVYGEMLKMADTSARPLWAPGDDRTQLWGSPIIFNPNMPDGTAATDRYLVYGDASKYQIVYGDYGDVEVFFDREAAAVANRQIKVAAYTLVGGGMLDAGTHPALSLRGA